ncbi:MAG: hypothetical protein ACI9DJ_000192 [Algoriphagus sp.]|jgi:hypothetical protein
MKIKLLIYLLTSSSLGLLSCGNMERLDTSKLKAEIEAHKIKRISETDIISFMNTHGQELIHVLEKEDCDLVLKEMDSLRNKVGFELVDLNPKTFRTTIEKEKQVMEALKYALAENAVLKPTFQKLSDTTYAFYFIKSHNDCRLENESDFWKLTFRKQDLILSM